MGATLESDPCIRGAINQFARRAIAGLAASYGGPTGRPGADTVARAVRGARTRFARRAIAGLAASYGGSIVRLVSDTVRGWDAGTVTARLESAVGRDLQYIRINGTLVGGLVGVLIHAIDHA